MNYIVTFYSHYAAMIFNRSLQDVSIKGVLRPVPRDLSSSCGTCVSFTFDDYSFEQVIDDMEAAYMLVNDSYVLVKGAYYG